MNRNFNLPPGCTANDVEGRRTRVPGRWMGISIMLPSEPEATGDQLSESQRYLLEQEREKEGKK